MPIHLPSVSVKKIPEISDGLAVLNGDGSNISDGVADDGGVSGGGIGAKIGHGISQLGSSISSGMQNLFSAPMGAVATVGQVFHNGASAIASALNVGEKTASVMLSAALVVGGGAVVTIGDLDAALNPTEIAQRSGGDVDCKKIIDEAKKQYGEGDREIPEEYEGSRVGFSLNQENTLEWYLNLNWADCTMQKFICDNLGSEMTYDENGFARLGDYYMGAISLESFGMTEDEEAQIGDWITFYFDDGTSFEWLVVDSKSSNDANYTPWGHKFGANDIDVCEAFGDRAKGMQTGEAGYDQIAGHDVKRVASFTNNGMAPEVYNHLSGAEKTADRNMRKAREKGMAKAANQCKNDCETPDADNSSAAKAALSITYSQSVHYGEGYPGTAFWLELYPKVIPEDGNTYPRSCDRTVCAAVRWSGTDEDFPPGPTEDQYSYMETSDRWERVTEFNGSNIDVLKPGDITITTGDGHISMFVGEELIKEHEFKGDANVGPVQAGAFSVSGSIGGGATAPDGRAPGVGADIAGPNAFRCVKPSGSSKYKDIADNVNMGAAMGCDSKERKKYKEDPNAKGDKVGGDGSADDNEEPGVEIVPDDYTGPTPGDSADDNAADDGDSHGVGECYFCD